ncbi:uncharacterized protein LOC109078316 isoform X1 [Cyprinus carpio]|uniref:Uncharacterized protein LOC109078316 isoform X1 n=1 Tax=Cyprinus carpio TaxID=7962 RepID=A0A9Q9Y0A9_CYPCA|nr:uncharacterized protein LOC109078316 isoform X1 [Cyprinus carpio]
MADTCHLFLLGLAILSSLLTGTSGVEDAHVFISSGGNVRLPCNNALHDCKSTTWLYNGFNHTTTVELINLGIKKTDTQKHERLSLGSNCSLNINNISTEDYGLYTCQQWTGVNRDKHQEPDARVYLHVLHVSQTEISAGLSVTLFCQLYSYPRVSCEDLIRSERIELFWVNQAGVKLMTDSRYQISSSSDHSNISLTTTFLNEDQNREWRCEVTHRDQVKASVTYTVKSSAPGSTLIPVSSSNSETTSSRTTAAAPTKDKQIITSNSETTTAAHRPAVTPLKVMVIIVEFAVFAAPTVILLQIICARRAGRKDSQHPEEIEINTILE